MNLEQLTLDIFAERILTQFDSKKYVNWAVKVMELGYVSENLFILAGFDNSLIAEREKYFFQTIKDLKINTLKSEDELIENYAKSIAEKVVKNEIDIDYAFKIMIRICSTTGYAQKYIAFYEIDEDLDYLYYNDSFIYNSGLTKKNKQEYIREEFEIFSKMENLNIPIDERNLSFCDDCKILMKPKLKPKFQLKKPFKFQVWSCSNCNSENLNFNNHEVKRMIIKKYE